MMTLISISVPRFRRVSGWRAVGATLSLSLAFGGLAVLPAPVAQAVPLAGVRAAVEPVLAAEVLAAASLPVFVDVAATNPFWDNIAWLASTGITTGWPMPDGSVQFRPGLPISREAMASFMFRAAGSPGFPMPTTASFTDVSPTSVHLTAVEWMAYAQISTGWVEADGSRTFRPSQPVTREAMASFLHRFHGTPPLPDTGGAAFTDVAAASVHRGAVEWLAHHGISTGWTLASGGAEFRPGQPVTREAMAAFLHRAHTYSHAGQFPTGHWNLGDTTPPTDEGVIQVTLDPDVPDGDFVIWLRGESHDLINGSVQVEVEPDAPALTFAIDQDSDLVLAGISMYLTGFGAIPTRLDWQSTAFTMLITSPEFVTADPATIFVLAHLAFQSPYLELLANAISVGGDTEELLQSLREDVANLGAALSQGNLPEPVSYFGIDPTASIVPQNSWANNWADCNPLSQFVEMWERHGQCIEHDITSNGPTDFTADITVRNTLGSWIALTTEEQPGESLANTSPHTRVPPVSFGGITATSILRDTVESVAGNTLIIIVSGACAISVPWFPRNTWSQRWAECAYNETLFEAAGSLTDQSWARAGKAEFHLTRADVPVQTFMTTLGRNTYSADIYLLESGGHFRDGTTTELALLTAVSYGVLPIVRLALGASSLADDIEKLPDQFFTPEEFNLLKAFLPRLADFGKVADGDLAALTRIFTGISNDILSLFTGDAPEPDLERARHILARLLGFTASDVFELGAQLVVSYGVKAFPVVGAIVAGADLAVNTGATIQQWDTFFDTALNNYRTVPVPSLWPGEWPETPIEPQNRAMANLVHNNAWPAPGIRVGSSLNAEIRRNIGPPGGLQVAGSVSLDPYPWDNWAAAGLVGKPAQINYTWYLNRGTHGVEGWEVVPGEISQTLELTEHHVGSIIRVAIEVIFENTDIGPLTMRANSEQRVQNRPPATEPWQPSDCHHRGLVFDVQTGMLSCDRWQNEWGSWENGQVITEPISGWHWDGATRTLYLTDFNWATESGVALQLTGFGTINLVLAGENRLISGEEGGSEALNIGWQTTVDISGSGSLSATGSSRGITNGGVITFNAGNLIGDGGESNQYGTTVGLTNSGTFTVLGGDVSFAGTWNGISNFGTFTINGGTVTASNTDLWVNSGLENRANGTFTVAGGQLLVTGGIVNHDPSWEMGTPSFYVTGGSVVTEGSSGSPAITNRYANFTITDGHVRVLGRPGILNTGNPSVSTRDSETIFTIAGGLLTIGETHQMETAIENANGAVFQVSGTGEVDALSVGLTKGWSSTILNESSFIVSGGEIRVSNTLSNGTRNAASEFAITGGSVIADRVDNQQPGIFTVAAGSLTALTEIYNRGGTFQITAPAYRWQTGLQQQQNTVVWDAFQYYPSSPFNLSMERERPVRIEVLTTEDTDPPDVVDPPDIVEPPTYVDPPEGFEWVPVTMADGREALRLYFPQLANATPETEIQSYFYWPDFGALRYSQCKSWVDGNEISHVADGRLVWCDFSIEFLGTLQWTLQTSWPMWDTENFIMPYLMITIWLDPYDPDLAEISFPISVPDVPQRPIPATPEPLTEFKWKVRPDSGADLRLYIPTFSNFPANTDLLAEWYWERDNIEIGLGTGCVNIDNRWNAPSVDAGFENGRLAWCDFRLSTLQARWDYENWGSFVPPDYLRLDIYTPERYGILNAGWWRLSIDNVPWTEVLDNLHQAGDWQFEISTAPWSEIVSIAP